MIYLLQRTQPSNSTAVLFSVGNVNEIKTTLEDLFDCIEARETSPGIWELSGLDVVDPKTYALEYQDDARMTVTLEEMSPADLEAMFRTAKTFADFESHLKMMVAIWDRFRKL